MVTFVFLCDVLIHSGLQLRKDTIKQVMCKGPAQGPTRGMLKVLGSHKIVISSPVPERPLLPTHIHYLHMSKFKRNT